MGSVIAGLESRGLIRPPSFVSANMHYEVMMGSVAYGVSTDTSDVDVYGWCIPPKDLIFPHLRGEIMGFGRQTQRFEQYQQHHIVDRSALGGKGKSYDLTAYSIVRYFHLCMEGNPNMVDSLFVPRNCVLHCTALGERVRESRRLFLHKGCWHKFKGYAFSQMHKMRTKSPQGKRAELVEEHGLDTKYAYHLVRLLDEVEQILAEGDLILDRNREKLKAIRRGEWSMADVEEYFASRERELEELYVRSDLRTTPDEATIKALLVECLEAHYGDLGEALIQPSREREALRAIRAILDRGGW